MQSNKDEKKYDVVISGMGPAGLATAIELSEAGKSVLIISNRAEEFTRKRLVTLSEKSRWYLYSMTLEEDDLSKTEKGKKFLTAVNRKHNVSIKNIEIYLKTKLDKLKKTGHPIDYRFNSELTEIDLEQGKAGIGPAKNNLQETKEEVEFTYLIGADGVNRHSLKLLQKTNQVPEVLEITHPDPQTLGTKHAILNFTIERKDGQPIELPEEQSIFIDDNEGIRFGLFVKLSSYLKSGKTSIKSQASSSYPEELNHIQDREQRIQAIQDYIIKSVKNILADIGSPSIEYEIKFISPDKASTPSQQPFTLFQTKSREVSQAAVKHNNHYLICVGDNVYDPDYRVGEGVSNAFKDAQDVKQIVANKMDLETYNKKRTERAANTRSRLNSGLKSKGG